MSFLANVFANTIAWSRDGTYLLFDTRQRTEDGQLARVDLTLRTPKFREDLFRDLFTEPDAQSGAAARQAPATPPGRRPPEPAGPAPPEPREPQNPGTPEPRRDREGRSRLRRHPPPSVAAAASAST